MNVVEDTRFQLLIEERGAKSVEILLNRMREEYPADWAKRPHYEELLQYVKAKAGA